jgi:hypothetical protein
MEMPQGRIRLSVAALSVRVDMALCFSGWTFLSLPETPLR